jgi:choline monooxygenase
MILAGLPVLHSLGSATMIQTTTGDFDWTLPSKDYRDPALFERERREIFAKNWMLFSWSGRLREPGDYVTGAVAGYPVFAMRDDEGRVRAFHNVCRHRGAQLLSEPSGHCGKLVVCPYHSWSYKRDGRLSKATDFGGDANFDPDAWSLYAVDAEEWRGLVFIRLKRGGPGLIEWLGPIHDMAADYPLEQQHYFMAKNRDVAVDWKTYGENYL